MNKRIITSMLPVLMFVTAYGQLPADSALLGSWQLTGYEIDGKFSPYTGVHIMTLFIDGVYQIYRQFPESIGVDSSNNHASGDWVLQRERGHLTLTRIQRIPLSFQSFSGITDQKVVQLTDSLIVLSGYEGKQLVLSHYHRIEPMPRIEKLHQLPEQKISERQHSPYALYLVNCGGTRKPVKINPEQGMELILKSPKPDAAIFNFIDVTMDVSLLDLHDTTLTLKLFEEKTLIEYTNFSQTRIANTFYPVEEFRDIPLGDIQYILYSPRTRSVLHTTGGFILFISSLTMLAAPLVSIQYKGGGFNGDRYLKWAGASLAGFAVGIPLTSLTNPKTYRLSNYHNNTPCPNCWSLEKKPLPQ